jgi:hypothetical protein
MPYLLEYIRGLFLNQYIHQKANTIKIINLSSLIMLRNV